MKLEEVKKTIRDIYDFPQKGIIFRDLTTAFKDADALCTISEELKKRYEGLGVTKVVGIESRGFIGGAVLARDLGAGFVPVRKPGKLPAKTISEEYEKEYGTDRIEMHEDALCSDDVVLIHDDLLATGGTMKATVNMVKRFNPKACYINFLIEIRDEGLAGREFIGDDTPIDVLINV